MPSVFCRKIYPSSLFFLLASCLFCCAALNGGSRVHAQEHKGTHALTNEDVIRMVRAHLGTEIIVAQIRDNPGSYSLTTDKLIQLKELGVPDAVISAMQAKAAAPATGGVSHAPYSQPNRNRPDTGHAAVSASAAQASHVVSLPARPLTGQPGGAETFTAQTCPNLGTDAILILNFLRLEPRTLDDETTLRQFVKLNNQCEQQYTVAQLTNELEYPEIAKAYKDKAAEILSGVPSEITLPWNGVAFGQYDTTRGVFPLDTANKLIMETARGTTGVDWSAEKLDFSPGSKLFPDSFRPIAFLTLTWTPFVARELPMSESDAKQFLAQLLQGAAAARARANANLLSVQGMATQGVIPPDTTRTVYPIVKIKILPTPPRILVATGSGGGRIVEKHYTVELSGQVSDVPILQYPPTRSKENPPLAILHPDPTAGGTEQQAEAFFYKKQYGEALPLAERACKAGYPRACGLEGLLYTLGLGVTADIGRGVNLIYDACENFDDAEACYLSVLAYQKVGSVTLASPDGRRETGLESDFSKSCSEGFADGCFQIAKTEYTATARSCGNADCPAMQIVWTAFDNACANGIQQSTAECGEGSSFACENLAMCYLRGAGVSKDAARAKQYFEQGCSLGDTEQCKEAQSNALSANPEADAGPGLGTAAPAQNAPETAPVPHSGMLGRAFAKFLASCNAGNAGACDRAGFDLDRGWGVDKDPQMARQFYEKSCSMGSREGCFDAKNASGN